MVALLSVPLGLGLALASVFMELPLAIAAIGMMAGVAALAVGCAFLFSSNRSDEGVRPPDDGDRRDPDYGE